MRKLAREYQLHKKKTKLKKKSKQQKNKTVQVLIYNNSKLGQNNSGSMTEKSFLVFRVTNGIQL